MAGAARPGPRHGDSGHWLERAEAMLAPLLHAAALGGRAMGDVTAWVLRQDLDTAAGLLAARGAAMAADVLAGLVPPTRGSCRASSPPPPGSSPPTGRCPPWPIADRPNFDPAAWRSPQRHRVSLRYRPGTGSPGAHHRGVHRGRPRRCLPGRPRPGSRDAPLTLVLDEVANIAPLPGLPALVSEGGGQGVVTLACLQDLSQARQRWGPAADGFASLFGTKVVLPGIGELTTLDLVSRLAGEVDVPARSVSRGPWWARRSGPTETWSTHAAAAPADRRGPPAAAGDRPGDAGALAAGASGAGAVVGHGAVPPGAADPREGWLRGRRPSPRPGPRRDGTPAPDPPVVGAGPGYQAAPW